jgi:hypothetical protein
MKRHCTFITLAVVLLMGSLLFFAGCGGGGGSDGGSSDYPVLAGKGTADPLNPSEPISEQKITPTAYAGNFVSSTDDDQVCYDMELLGYIAAVTSEMRGFKVDPPVDFTNDFVSVTLSEDGKFLAWEISNNTKMLAFIIKGGPNYNVYDYVSYDFTSDSGLGAPLYKKDHPQISHYNFCYQPEVPAGDQGCTPGYWRNHANRWTGAEPTDDFDATFGVDLFTPDITLGQAIQLGGGGVNALARHATAALLNAYGGIPNDDGNNTTVAYPYTAGKVIEMVQDAVANSSTIEDTKDLFAAANELGCPLNGTKALRVK